MLDVNLYDRSRINEVNNILLEGVTKSLALKSRVAGWTFGTKVVPILLDAYPIDNDNWTYHVLGQIDWHSKIQRMLLSFRKDTKRLDTALQRLAKKQNWELKIHSIDDNFIRFEFTIP